MRRALVLCALLVGCGSAAPRTSAPSARPRVVVVAVYDQLGSDVLAAHLPHLDPEGAIRGAIARGRYVRRARFASSATFTAPGHAAIHTGASPRDSGIGSNRVFVPGRGRVSAMADGTHLVWGREDASASPFRLHAETVGDVIQSERPASVVVSLALKDRAAIMPGGQHPDLCLWFDPEAGGFTSSAWYGAAMPEWLASWRGREPFEAVMDPPWTPRDPASLEARFGPDTQPGEGAYGFDASFPHDARGLEDEDAFRSLPASTDHMLALAREIVTRLEVGDDDEPDLLALSIATTDYVGHAFGPSSWEYADALVRVDRALGDFVRELEARVGPIALVITSDHGAAELVERTHASGHEDALRFTSESSLPRLQAHLRETLGPPPEGVDAWAKGWVQPYVYLGAHEPRVIEAALAWLRAQPGIGAAVDARAVAAAPVPEGESLDALIARAIPRDPPGDIYVMPAERSVAMEDMPEGVGTSHGSAWLYDRDVPVIVVGPHVTREEITEVAPQCRVAGTIAALADVRAPRFACGAL
ncbi:alkaline phosphatase family protein [Sandaracinus amylolyticus]|uniref:alkaline phosphatase family protein n=1 Tax=Sandaracinus amylolyticus TaxID=927083 RepID=UPI001F383BF5|nr:alkaline phosphatase family protein [Sandaracinus amylolyticus]UJR80186.1 Alkaline phosphatase [Sandaracinus amylolyticus]